MASDRPELPAAPAFDALVREAVSLIPAYAPEWTNHNPSDPGITLVELLAYYTEILAWRALRVTPDAKLFFLRLLDGGANDDQERLRGLPAAAVDDAIRSRVQAMSQAQCAVTCSDFERWAVEEARGHLGQGHAVRAHCVAGVDLRVAHVHGISAAAVASAEAAADMSLVLAPEQDLDDDQLDALCTHVQRELAPRCLLTTRVHVVAPTYLRVSVGCRLALHHGAELPVVLKAIDEALRLRFGPAAAGEAPTGERALGRTLHLSEVAEVIDRTAGADFVEAITLQSIEIRGGVEDEANGRIGVRIGFVSRPGVDARFGGRASVPMHRITLDDSGEAEAIRLYPWEMVRVRLEHDAVSVITEPATAEFGYGHER